MSTETDQAAARKAQDLYRFDGSDPDMILAPAWTGATNASPSVLLTAAPSATRDEVARALEGEFGCFLARDPHRPDAFWGGAADALLARFTITPKENHDDPHDHDR